MTITRVGATKRYSDNWEQIFGRGKKRSATKRATAKSVSRPAEKKSAKKKATKKTRRRK